MSEDGYTRITLRIPDALDERLNEAAKATSKSKNAEIVSRLQESFSENHAAIPSSFVSVPHYDNASQPLVLPAALLGTSYLSKNCKYCYAFGTSMEPTLFDGDIVVVDWILPQTGNLIAFTMNDELFIRRVTKDKGSFLVESDNSSFPARIFTKDTYKQDGFSMIGTVICVIGRR